MKAWAVIPARHASTRFPGKMLADLCGKPLIQHVWEGASSSRLLSRVLIATDHEEIKGVAEGFGADVVMTDPNLPSGTDRVAAAVGSADGVDWVVNVQGDEPLIRGGDLDDFLKKISPNFGMATLARRIGPRMAQDTNVVKVVSGLDGNALYFSRAPIPHPREREDEADYWHHIGIYAYAPVVLRKLVSLSPSSLEKTEKLEQLRALQNGVAIQVIPTSVEYIGVDTPEDLRRVEARIRGS